MKQYLVQYIREFSDQPYFFAHFASHLNPAETETVRSIQGWSKLDWAILTNF